MYVLTVIRPPADGAAFGKTKIYPPVTNIVDAGGRAHSVMVGDARQFLTWAAADRYRNELISRAMRDGQVELAVPSGYTFRIDPADNAPHPCPCCGRIVLPADLEGALCAGCYTFDNTEQCLPVNSAHAEEPK